ncbi:hypothetical protein TrLO_g7223 [Triparma laevis f. longispina]|uniref:Eukaryotic translation initiation factor 3 subunit L n=1 Tax=Triparma laevis f. longispina TaxID=1714387 RepID=A0A9W6ZL59_9STRA|nr:hypothetical protein TrLO_g7223 [Triparma laevis f. longispina]
MSSEPKDEIPSAVRDFVFDLHDACRRSQRPEEMKALYSGVFVELSAKHYTHKPWPSAEEMSSECESDELFLNFYSELTTRHLFNNLRPTLNDKINAWKTYSSLFDQMLTLKDDTKADAFHVLPEWAFELIHEYVYQFQGFCQFRTHLAQRTAEEKELLEANKDVWDVGTVMKHLHGLIGASGLKTDPTGASAHGQSLYMMGYFAALSLSRLECLLGDFHGSLDALSCMNINEKGELYWNIFAARVSLSYHAGVSYFALRRYRDAAKTFSDMCSAINKGVNSGYLKRLTGYEQFMKLNDKMLAFLAIISLIQPAIKIEDSLSKVTNQMFGDKLAKVEGGDEGFDEIFSFACPKFVSPVVPDYKSSEEPRNLSAIAYSKQVRQCVDDIKSTSNLVRLRSYLKLYTSIDVAKLATFCEIEESAMANRVLALKKTICAQLEHQRKQGPPLAGTVVDHGDVGFHMAGSTVNVDPVVRGSKKTHRFFLNNVGSAKELAADVLQIPDFV